MDFMSSLINPTANIDAATKDYINAELEKMRQTMEEIKKTAETQAKNKAIMEANKAIMEANALIVQKNIDALKKNMGEKKRVCPPGWEVCPMTAIVHDGKNAYCADCGMSMGPATECEWVGEKKETTFSVLVPKTSRPTDRCIASTSSNQ